MDQLVVGGVLARGRSALCLRGRFGKGSGGDALRRRAGPAAVFRVAHRRAPRIRSIISSYELLASRKYKSFSSFLAPRSSRGLARADRARSEEHTSELQSH